MRLEIVTPPAQEPITLDDARQQLRAVGFSFDDSVINRYISTARIAAEACAKRTFLTTTYDLFLDGFPIGGTGAWNYIQSQRSGAFFSPYPHETDIVLVKPPIQSITWVKYYDSTGSIQTLDPSLYLFHPGTPGRIEALPSTSFPLTLLRREAVNIRFVAGYGDEPSSVPAVAISAIGLYLTFLYNNRGDSPAVLPAAFADLLSSISTGSYQ